MQLSHEKPYVVIGLGRTGLSCIRYLHQHGISIIAMDLHTNPSCVNEIESHWPHIPIILGYLDKKILCSAAEVIVSPGVALEEPALVECMADGVAVVGDIELFARQIKAPVVGITGTNAKGTVTTLVAQMAQAAGLKVQLGGNIGIPVLDLLQEPEPELYVLELSSFQLETTHTLMLKAAVILNISEDHLDRHKTMVNYIKAKQRIFQHCEIAVTNRDDPQTQLPSNISSSKKTLSFGLGKPTQADEFGIINDGTMPWLAIGMQTLLPVNELRIKGQHNWANALAALALGTALHLPMEKMLQTLRQFPGLSHRCQWIANIDNVNWYNDSKGTNIGATIAAIDGLGSELFGKIILIAGGIGKGADFTLLQSAVKKYVRTLILFGQDAALLEKALTGMTQIIQAKDLADCVQLAKQYAQAGDIVLLSPACSSLDMFKNFAERGDKFISHVQGLLSL